MSRFHLSKGRYTAPQYRRYSDYFRKPLGVGQESAAPPPLDNDVPDTHGSYGALILHPQWKARRKEILLRDNFKCIVCESEKELQVHHRQYHFIKALNKFKAPWDYPSNLLITLCSKCHARGHSKFKVPSVKI